MLFYITIILMYIYLLKFIRINVRYYLLLIFFYILLINYYVFIYWPMFIFFTIYWFFRFLYYIIMKNDKEIVPYKFKYEGNYIKIYIFYKLIVITYLNAFFICYSLLKFKYKRPEKIKIRVDLLTEMIRNLAIRIITGFSVKLYKDARYCAKKWISIREDILNTATPNKSYEHTLYSFVFNILADSIPETNRIERRKIYKTNNALWNFNPDKEKIIKLFNILFPKIELRFPTSINEERIADLISKYSIGSKNEAKKYFFSINDSKKHYGTLYNCLNKDKNTFFGTNFTSNSTTFNKENLELSEKAYLIKPYRVEENIVKIYQEKNIFKSNDDRLIFDEFYIQELYILSSLYFNDFKLINIDNNHNIFLKNSEKPKFIKESLLGDFDKELIKFKNSLNPKLWTDHQTLFKQSIVKTLESPETFDTLEYLSAKNI